jgi:AcrR family transcriptional regulator
VARKLGQRSELVPALAEIFREHGFAGASLSEITRATGLGKGSLYHFFPAGKNEMGKAVLDDVDGWFRTNVFEPLQQHPDPAAGMEHMFKAVDRFFDSGRRICLVGSFALDDTRDRFASDVQSYFAAWIAALASTLKRSGFDTRSARETAEEVVAGIQGALVLARSQDDPKIFKRAIKRLKQRTNRELA